MLIYNNYNYTSSVLAQTHIYVIFPFPKNETHQINQNSIAVGISIEIAHIFAEKKSIKIAF